MKRLLGAIVCAIGLGLTLGMPCEVEAAPRLRILAPHDGDVVDDDRTDVRGAFALAAGTEVAVTVNGISAAVSGAGFLAGAVPLQPGSNTLSITATGEDGATTRVVTLWSNGKSPLRLNAAVSSGAAPFKASLTVEDQLGRSIARLDVQFGDGGGVVLDPYLQGSDFEHVYQRPGIYVVSVAVTLADGSVHNLQKTVSVADPLATEARLQMIWNRFGQALASGDRGKALGLLTQPARMKYEAVFDALLAQMPEVVESFSPLHKVALSPRLGEYAVARTVDGGSRVYFVHFMLDTDGLWRLEDL